MREIQGMLSLVFVNATKPVITDPGSISAVWIPAFLNIQYYKNMCTEQPIVVISSLLESIFLSVHSTFSANQTESKNTVLL